MNKIVVLDEQTIDKIAAGEVVERPASVVKELVENAIDAGATQITLSAVRGGIQQLQIVDNGSGIEAEYIDKAFIRHATSKIATAEDLGHIHTLGFRGEALASIASVARVEVLTRTEADEYACCYRIEGGEERGMEPGARPVGTTITVSDLFYNTPARMKFLKKDASEGTFVAETVLHAALSHPEISFRYLRDGKQQYVTPGDGDLRSAVYAVLGREFARDLLPVDGGSELYHVTGLVTPPRACRASRGAQHFFVNGRYVKNRTMMAALENAYKGTMMQGKDCQAALNITEDGFSTTATLKTNGNKIEVTDRSGFSMTIEADPGAVAENGGAVTAEIEVLSAGTMVIQTGSNEGEQLAIDIPELNAKSLGVDELIMYTHEYASQAVDIIDEAVKKVSAARSKLGAYENRLDDVHSNLEVQSESITEAYSRIMDTDMAEEMTEYTQQEVLSQAAISMMQKANDRPESLLQLLQ